MRSTGFFFADAYSLSFKIRNAFYIIVTAYCDLTAFGEQSCYCAEIMVFFGKAVSAVLRIVYYVGLNHCHLKIVF